LASGRLRRVFLRTLGRHHFLRTHHPVRRLAGSITTIVACASASYARDRPAASNQSPHAKNYERDPLSFSHDRPDRRGPRSPHMCAPTSTSAGFLGQAPLLRFSSPATLTGCARAVRGGQPPDDPASAFPSFACVGPRAFFSKRPADEMDFRVRALAVFRWSGFVAMKLAWRTRFRRSEAFQSNPSLARRG